MAHSRTISSPNWLGIKTLYTKEVMRFLKVYNQTLVAPVINSLLLLAIFSLALGDRIEMIGGVSFQVFMASGLVMMSVVQHAFANTSSAFIMGKVVGMIIDYLMPPLSTGEMLFSMVMGGVTRGVCVGVLVGVSLWMFLPLQVVHPFLAIFYLVAASMMLALLGMLAGIFADSFDEMSAITSYVITPLSFLSGTFYSVQHLPPLWYTVTHFNPFFYMIDGFRYSMTNYHDGSIAVGMALLTTCNIVLWLACHLLLKAGYRIKS